MNQGIARADQLLTKMLIVSLLGHVTFLAVQSLLPERWGSREIRRPLKLVQDSRAVREAPEQGAELGGMVHARLTNLPNAPSPGAVGSALAESFQARSLSSGPEGQLTTEGPVAWDRSASDFSVAAYHGLWTTAIDLTNISLAAQGNPVLLSYFGAIRAQIQHTANQRTWVAQSTQRGGVVYVGLVIGSTGAIQSASVISDRSSEAVDLQAAALEIVRSSSPFPPLPPSTAASSKVMVVTVPIEFVVGP